MINENINYEHNLGFNKIMRGQVMYNLDPSNKGRIKIWIPGIYPEAFKTDYAKLPWAEPMMPLMGGNWTEKNMDSFNEETGVTTIPFVGAELFVFFENGDQNRPIFFGACQGGSGWMSEHINQHVVQTKNVRLRIDEDPTHEKSTNKFTSNAELNPNTKDTAHIKKNNPTRVDIEIVNIGKCALNVYIKGDVNMKIDGNFYEQITGNKYETLIGNLYRYHKGDIEYSHDGNTVFVIKGKTSNTFDGTVTSIYTKDKLTTVTGKQVYNCLNDNIWTVVGMDTKTVLQNYTENISGTKTCTVIGPMTTTCFGAMSNLCSENILNISAKNYVDVAGIGAHRYVFTGFILDKALICSRKALTVLTDEALTSATRSAGYVLDQTSSIIDHNLGAVPVITPTPEGVTL